MKKHALIREGIPTVIVLVIFGIILYLIMPVLTILAFGLIVFVLYFFRDPKRSIREQTGVILAAADGIVTVVEAVDESKFIKGRAKCVSIFMSPLDVHINRSPIKGEVTFVQYQKGRFVPATTKKCYEVNEKNYIGIKGEKVSVLVVQVAGIMARRIVNWTKQGDHVEMGERIGMIKFSSGTQIIVPDHVEILVKEGDRVFAGETVIGRY